MKIALDLQCLQSESRHVGIGRYSFSLAQAMIRCAPGDDFLILLNSRLPQMIQNIRHEFRDLLPQCDIKVFDIPNGDYYFNRGYERRSVARIARDAFIRDIGPDVLHISSAFEGLPCCPDSFNGGLADGVPVAATFYDLIPLVYQDEYLATPKDRDSYLMTLRSFCRADLLLAISQFTADEGRRLLKDFSGRIVNIGGAMDSSFSPGGNPESIRETLGRYNVEKPFVFSAASFDPRKNQSRLIQAFASLPEKLRKSHQLVLSGGISRDTYAKLRELIRLSGLAEKDVIITKRISDAELLDLYRSCRLFVFPSFYEGLGLPVLEAMASGAPTVAADASSTAELLASPEAGFDPFSVPSMSACIGGFLSDPDQIERLRKQGLAKSAEFTWEATASKAVDAIRELGERAQKASAAHGSRRGATGALGALQNLDDDDRLRCAQSVAINEIELNYDWCLSAPRTSAWVTAWGRRCDIASYAKGLLDSLAAKPTIFCQKNGAPSSGADYTTIPSWRQGIEDPLRELFDNLIQRDFDEIVIHFDFGMFHTQAIAGLIHRLADRNKTIFVILHSALYPANVTGFRLTEMAGSLQRADAIFVHTKSDMEVLAKHCVARNVRFLPFGVAIQPAPHREKPRRARTISTYGHLGIGRGLEEILDAMRILAAQDPDLRLKIVNADRNDLGEASEAPMQKIRESGLEERISLAAGNLDTGETIRLLQETELVVLSQQGSDTRTAGAAVRTGLASGVPIAIAPLPGFSDISDVAFQLPGHKPDEVAVGIRSALRHIAENSETARKVQSAAALWRKSHDFAEVAKHLDRRMAAASFGAHIG